MARKTSGLFAGGVVVQRFLRLLSLSGTQVGDLVYHSLCSFAEALGVPSNTGPRGDPNQKPVRETLEQAPIDAIGTENVTALFKFLGISERHHTLVEPNIVLAKVIAVCTQAI